MTPERWQKVKQIFHSALDRAPGERSAFLANACGSDESLRKEVESLIASHEKGGTFIDAPAYQAAAELFVKDESELEPGQTIASYEIISLIGRGGMGEVYLAQDVRLGRKVALKLLPASVIADRDRLRRFEQEARAASGLNHPNILTIHGVEEVEGRRFITTEFIDGVTLRQRMAESPIDVHETLDIAIHVASALVAAHRVKIVHRDIKPENIMVRRDDGLVKVLDFGLAKPTERLSGTAPDPEAPTRALVNTGPGVVMGTVAYMSPEQARGLAVDERTDIWSLGVVLYEMIAGKVPFAGTASNEIISQILSKEQPAPLARFAHDLPAELERIVSKALTKDREERYQTAKDLLIDLKRLRQKIEVDVEIDRSIRPEARTGAATATAGEQSAAASTPAMAQTGTATAPPTTSAEYIVSEIKRHKRGVLLALTLFIIAGAGVTYWLYKFMGQNKRTTPSLTKISRLTSTGKATHSAISPDGKYVVYSMDEAGQQSLWLSQVAISSNVQIVPNAEVDYLGITFSRDGNLIYYVRNEQDNRGVLYQAPALGGGGERKLLVDVHSSITLSPDGKRLAFLRRYPTSPGGDALMVANADGSEEKILFTLKEPNLFGPGAPAWSPDGKIIACGRQNYSGSFYANMIGVHVADGTEIPITSQRWEGLNIGRIAWLADGSGLIVTVPEQQGSLPQIWHLGFPDGDARKIVNDLNGYFDVSLTADSGTLATVRTDRLLNVWVAPGGDASSAKRITSGAGRDDGVGGLNWAPDNRIVYRSMAGNALNIWIMAADGTGNKQLSVSAGHNNSPSVSPDGRYLVWVTADFGAVGQIWRMDLNGGNRKQLTNRGSVWYPQLSPDGKWVVYGTIGGGIDYHSIWKVPIDGGASIQLTDKPSWAPVVSPDEKLIACNWLDESSGQWKIAVLPFEGGQPTKIFDIQGAYTRPLRWPPDGRAIAYIQTNQGVSNIWAQPLDGGPPKKLTDFKDQRIFNFAWSRDGKQLALSRGTVNSDVVLISGFK